MRSRILIGLIAGTIGGFLGWLLQESLIHYQVIKDASGVVKAVPLTLTETRTLIYCVGGLIGLFLGAVDGIVESNSRKLIKGMWVGALAGILLGYIGMLIGESIFTALGGSTELKTNPGVFDFAKQVIARTMGLTLLGVGIGAGSAFSTLSLKRIRNGALGGLIGGFIGGFVFDMVASAASPVQSAAGASQIFESGGPSRAICFTLIGALTGFFANLIEELLKDAWVKVLAGRNEGKDFILGKSMNLLGREERCDVPLFGDNSVGVQHAAIRADGNRHVLLDAGTPLGTTVNGQKVASGGEQLLRDGDMIQIGQHRILFREKVTASKFQRQPVDAPKTKSPSANVPMPGHLCPYCGAAKDSSGNCLCTLAGGASASSGMGVNPAPGFGTPSGASGYGPMSPAPGYAPSDYGSPAMGGMPGYGAPVATAGSMGTQIVGVEGPYTGQGFPLLGPNMVVGREMTCDIALTADTTISRNHARLALEGGGMVVYDNGSSNGTYVNGMRVTAPVMLAPGDIVQFGSSKFRLE